MRRTGSKRAGSSVSSGSEQGFWPSYADMMSAVALILFFLMLLAYIQNLVTGNTLKDTQNELSTVAIQLSTTQSELLSTEDELNKIKEALVIKLSEIDAAEVKLSQITADLDAANLALTQKQQELNAKQLELNAKQQEINSQDTALKDQQQVISQQQANLKAANEELEEMRGQMQSIAVLRLSILEQIRDSLVEVTGDKTKVTIGDNGNIILSEGILFDVGSSEIKKDAEPTLNELITVLKKFLANEQSVQYVDSIVISGHTDSTGTDKNNRLLSTDRANAVLNYLMQGKNSALSPYAKYFCSAGYGESRPVATNDTEAGKAANRRIEISITLKDDSILDIVESYLDTANG